MGLEHLLTFHPKIRIYMRTSIEFPSQKKNFIRTSTDFGFGYLLAVHLKRRIWIRTSTDFPSQKGECGSEHLLNLLRIYIEFDLEH